MLNVNGNITPRRGFLARLAAGNGLLDSTPLYLRESDAQVPGPRKRAL